MIKIKNVECYGEMSEYASVSMECEWASGEQFHQMYLGSQGFTTWTQLVNYSVLAGEEEGYTIDQMESDE
tara:strand:+ start:3543 stop:3752 length:210 start_codon:yes stop_codon:yes gene_type:complete